MSQEINNELELIRSILRGYKPSMARDDALYATARVKRLVGQDRAQRGEPVAWIVFAEVAGEMVPQHPSRPTLESAESDARMYAVKTEVRPLYTAPQPERKPMMDQTAHDMNLVAEKYAHKLALDLECVLADYSGTWYETAMKTLGDYRSAMNAIHERESPTFMGEPLILKDTP